MKHPEGMKEISRWCNHRTGSSNMKNGIPAGMPEIVQRPFRAHMILGTAMSGGYTTG
jgi:hypothetical protein